MSSSESSFSSRNILYKVFIHRGSEINPRINKTQLEEWFGTLVEPFKMNVRPAGDYGFAYFASKRDARACIAAFNKQPPYFYNISVGEPEEYLMNEKDIKRLKMELEYKAERLEYIKIQMRELRIEKTRLTNDLGCLTDYCNSDSEVDEITSDDLERLNSEQETNFGNIQNNEPHLTKHQIRSKSRMQQTYDQPGKSVNKQQNSNNVSGRSRQRRSLQQNSNVNNNNKNTRHSIASTSSNDITKQRRNSVCSTNKENISSTQREIPVETIPNNRFVQGTIQYIDKGKEFWITLTSNNDQLNKINVLLYDAPKHCIIPANNINLHCYCIVEFNGNGIWYRAKVIGKQKPNVNILRLIDYGNQITHINTIVEMPEYLYKIPAQAIKISFSSLKYENIRIQQKINIKAISYKNNLTFCEISSTVDNFKNEFSQSNSKNESSSQANRHNNPRKQSTTPIKQKFDKRECIIKSLKMSHKGTLKIKTIIDSETCVCQITIMGDDFSNYVQAIQNIWEKYPTNYIQPKVGDLVCVENDDSESWSRGYVINDESHKYQIGLIDDGVIVNNIAKCCKLLPEHVQIPDFACLCNIIEVLCNQQKFKKLYTENKTYSFIIKSMNTDETTNLPDVKCILKDRKTKEDICEIKLSNWILSVKKHDSNHSDSDTNSINPKVVINQQNIIKYDGIIQKMHLSLDSTVMIAFVESQQILYVKYRESNQHIKRITELIQSSISTLTPMNIKLAKIGKCVAAQFSEDQAWYRGEILSINNNTNMATVLYIDYGNKEQVQINQTKILTQQLLEIPRAVVEIKLHKLSNKPLTLSQVKYIDECMESKTKYKIIPNALSTDVSLVNIKNETEILNEKLLYLLSEKFENNEKHSLKEANKKMNVTLSKSISQEEDESVDISFVELPIGKTKVIFEDVLEPKERIIACYPNDIDNLLHVTTTLTQKIREYILNNKKEMSYKPPQGTPCIAKYEDSWYRALCLDIDHGSAIVMFVDFGNHDKVEFTNIRKLPKEFAKDPAVALICTVMDVPLEISETEFTNSLEKLNTYDVEVIEKEDIGQYNIIIPGISATN